MLKCRILRKVVKYFQHRVFQNGMYFELISRIDDIILYTRRLAYIIR